MNKLLKNKTAIITGGNGGIGKGIAVLFVQQGCNVAIFGTNQQKGEQTIAELKELLSPEQQVKFFQVDVADTQSVDEIIKKVIEDFSQIDILINNAGITRDNLLMRISEEDWDAVLNTNLKSIYNTCKAVVRPMLKAKRGKIINISSVVGLIGNAGQANYAASKAGMIGFSKSLAKEIAPRNICVNCIAPGFIDTAMTDKLNDTQKQSLSSQIPMQRFGTTSDIANAALFLSSDLSDYITGQVITVDGGMVMH